MGSGSITDSSGQISFDNENLIVGRIALGGATTFDNTFNVVKGGGNFGVEQQTSTLPSGGSLQFKAGEPAAAAANKDGGTVNFYGGSSHGSGGSYVKFYTATPGAAGSGTHTATQKWSISEDGTLFSGTTESTGIPGYNIMTAGNITTTGMNNNLGNLTVTGLSGTGTAYACIDANGKLYRSGTACT